MRGASWAAIIFLIMAIFGGSYYFLETIASQPFSGSKNTSITIQEKQSVSGPISSSGSVRPPPSQYTQTYKTTPKPTLSYGWIVVAIVALSITTLTSTAISFYLYRWRRILLNQPHSEIVVPEQFSGWVNGIDAQITKLTNQLGSGIEYVAHQSEEANKNVSNLTETYMTLQQALDERDAEIRRLKSGYDAEIFRKFIARFIRVDQVVEELQNTKSLGSNELEHIRRLLEDALAECGVESFQPDIGADYRQADGVADNPKSIQSENPDDAFKINEVLECGYQLQTNEGYDVIIPAKVKIYSA